MGIMKYKDRFLKYSLNRFKNINLTNADNYYLIPALRIAIRPVKHQEDRNPGGRAGALEVKRSIVTDLFKNERVEDTFVSLSETRGYAERLIAEAARHGPTHRRTMDIAQFWVTDRDTLRKLFEEIVPRYHGSQMSYTKMYKAPSGYKHETSKGRPSDDMAILELRNNILVPVAPRLRPTRNWISNVLLEEARKEHRENREKEEVALLLKEEEV